jgi:two-component system NtrC family response regulator
MSKIVQENTLLKDAIQSRYQFDNIIGKSKTMQALYDIIKKVAPTSASVLVEGESGTGKELVAKSIHYNSMRKDHPLIAVNCSAFAESLLESELFGHEKGAFTGAVGLKKGRFEMADKGTLFLDEIGELPMPLQVKLLRVLQERTVERVGGTVSLAVDFRLIAATNKILEDEVKNGKFREDLYYRLNVVKANIPPLRDRLEDIPLLIKHFIEKYTQGPERAGIVTGIDKEAIQRLCDYEWRGNVRELENVIERAIILAKGSIITVSDLPSQIRNPKAGTLQLDGIPDGVGLSETLAAVEKRMILRAMKMSGNVQTTAAKILGIGKSGLNQKLKKFNLDKELKLDNK